MTKPEVLQRLKQHLQIAVMLEFSTLPPYLCACWSIHGTSAHARQVRQFISSVVQEEMLHMAMACNILNAIGGRPVLNEPDLHPVFPCSLPGHSKTHHAFIVELNKCCPAALKTFLQIELPEAFNGDGHHPDGWCTIGEFYDEIASLLNHPALNDSDFAYGRQVGNQYNPARGILYEVHNRSDACKALEEIIDQGEGHSGKMYDQDHQLTHYWKFSAIYDLMENEIWNYEDEVYNMAPNPDERFFSAEAKKLNRQFCLAWTALLEEMHRAFNREAPSLDKSIEWMFRLKDPAIALMQIPLTGKAGNAGPTFSFIRATEKSSGGKNPV